MDTGWIVLGLLVALLIYNLPPECPQCGKFMNRKRVCEHCFPPPEEIGWRQPKI